MPLERQRTTTLAATARQAALALTALLALSVAGCNRQAMKRAPDMSRGKFERVAPEISVKSSSGAGTTNALALTQLAQHRLQTGETKEAVRLARLAVKGDPKSATAHMILGLSLDRSGQAAEAGASHRRAAELAPTRGDVLNNYGVWLCGQGRAAESLQWFDRAAAAPGYATPAAARGNAGACALRAGQAERAEPDLRAAIAVDPDNALALEALAQLAYGRGRLMEARAFSQRRLAAAAPSREALQLASQIEQKLGDSDAERRYVQQMLNEFPDPAGPGNRGTDGR